MAKYIFHYASGRGTTNYGWLHTRHSFSFGDYYNPQRLHFGALRVLNDDKLAPAKGFGMHPHNNMEIITLPLQGFIEHKDNMENVGTIGVGEVQIMSAGKGVYHSEYNASRTESLKLLQIWILPEIQNVNPRYVQGKYSIENNAFTTIVSPQHEGNQLWIHQQAWLSIGQFEKEKSTVYHFNKKVAQCVYVFLVSGKILVDNQVLSPRDAIGVSDVESINIHCETDAQFVIIEVPTL